MHPNRTSRRIDRAGTDWTTPPHLTPWQRERAFAWSDERRTGLTLARDWAAITLASIALWLVIAGIVAAIVALAS